MSAGGHEKPVRESGMHRSHSYREMIECQSGEKTWSSLIWWITADTRCATTRGETCVKDTSSPCSPRVSESLSLRLLSVCPSSQELASGSKLKRFIVIALSLSSAALERHPQLVGNTVERRRRRGRGEERTGRGGEERGGPGGEERTGPVSQRETLLNMTSD